MTDPTLFERQEIIMGEPKLIEQGRALAPAPEQTIATGEATAIIQMIERAAQNPAVDIDKMERLLEMQERVMARRAKAAYFAALAEMQPELPVIAERGKISTDRGKTVQSTYALWEDINEAIRPVLAQHGFALSFRTGKNDAAITVTGVLSHREGHSEETTLELPSDGSGSKNAVQAVGSSTSYGKRYTAQALLNLTSRGEDDDGQAGGARDQTAAVSTAIGMINECNTDAELTAWKTKNERVIATLSQPEQTAIIGAYNDRRSRMKEAAQ